MQTMISTLLPALARAMQLRERAAYYAREEYGAVNLAGVVTTIVQNRVERAGVTDPAHLAEIDEDTAACRLLLAGCP